MKKKTTYHLFYLLISVLCWTVQSCSTLPEAAVLGKETIREQAESNVNAPLKDALEKKYDEAMSYKLGLNRVQLNDDEALKRLKSACVDCPEILAQLAGFAHDGSWAPLLPVDENAARELSKIALIEGLAKRADDGRPAAQYGMSILHEYGLNLKQDPEKAAQMAVTAAENGCAFAQLNLGMKSYDPFEKKGIDPCKAAYWYEKAASRGVADAQFLLGLMYLRGSGVEENLQKAGELFQLASKQGQDQAFVQSTILNSIKNCSTLISEEPQNAHAYFNRAVSYYQISKFDKAIEDCSRAAELSPDDEWTYFYRGGAYLELKQYDKAIQDYDKLVLLKPDSDWVYRGRALVQILRGKFENAVSDAEKARQLASNNDNLAMLGIAYLGLKLPDRTIELLRPLKPLDAHTAIGLSLAYKMKGNDLEAEKYRLDAARADDYNGYKEELEKIERAVIGN